MFKMWLSESFCLPLACFFIFSMINDHLLLSWKTGRFENLRSQIHQLGRGLMRIFGCVHCNFFTLYNSYENKIYPLYCEGNTT